MRKWGLGVFILLVFTACKKEPLPDLPNETGPYYYVRGEANGESFNYNVGDDNISLTNGVSHVNNVESYWGQISALTDQMYVKVEVIRPEVYFTSTGFHALQNGTVPFFVNEPGCYLMDFGLNYNQQNYVLVKDPNNSFELMDQIEYDEFGIYNLTLKFTDISNTNSYTIPVNHGFNNEELNPAFMVEGWQDSLILYPMATTGSHQWFVNSQLVSEEAQLTYLFPNGIHKIDHIVIDEFGNRSETCDLIRVTDSVFDWHFKLNPCGASHPSNYGEIIISVFHNGQWYYSDIAASNNQRELTITNVEYIGEQTLEPAQAIFECKFDCVLYNESMTDSLSLNQVVSKINVDLKN